jgi:hypothetical protein
MRKVIALLVVCGSFAAIATPGALANNPHNEENPTGKPEFSCQEINKANGTAGEANPFAPGKAQFSPGSPFNEGEVEGIPGPGNGGAHYSENARYDVACFQHEQHALAGH